MKLEVEVRGDLRKVMSQKVDDAKLAVSAGVQRTGRGLKAEWRAAVAGALGRRLGNAIRQKDYPEDGHPSLRTAALVYAQPAKNGRGAAAIVSAFDKGVTIKPSTRRYLAIPLPAAGVGPKGSRISPEAWERQKGKKLVVLPVKGGSVTAYDRTGMGRSFGSGSLLLADISVAKEGARVWRRKSVNGKRTWGWYEPNLGRVRLPQKPVPMFVLVPVVKLPKKFDLSAAAAKAQGALAGNIVAAWPKEQV